MTDTNNTKSQTTQCAHVWNDEGEKCLKCGDSDWMAQPPGLYRVKAPISVTREAIEKDKALAPRSPREAHYRTEQQIVDQTEALAVFLLSWCFNHKPETKTPMRQSSHPYAERCWSAACHIQEMLTDTDPENAVAEVDGAIHHKAETVKDEAHTMVKMIDAAMVATREMHPPITRDLCKRIIAAASRIEG